jgi:tRNA pseudouridine32 synthase/23S rRNA pseudouridine746 synthase
MAEAPVAVDETVSSEPIYRVITRTDDFVAISKAPGVSVHRDDASHGLVETVAAELGYPRLFLVHRLDRMTSGLLLLATSAAACAALAALFAQRRVEKYYLALSDRRPARKQGQVRGDMERARNGSWRLSRGQTDPAVTHFFSRSLAPGLRLFVLRPGTGKTHQLRVAMKSLGAPILGDDRYGGSDADRGYLHAYALRFQHAGQPITLLDRPLQGEHFAGTALAGMTNEEREPWLLPWPPQLHGPGSAGGNPAPATV